MGVEENIMIWEKKGHSILLQHLSNSLFKVSQDLVIF